MPEGRVIAIGAVGVGVLGGAVHRLSVCASPPPPPHSRTGARSRDSGSPPPRSPPPGRARDGFSCSVGRWSACWPPCWREARRSRPDWCSRRLPWRRAASLRWARSSSGRPSSTVRWPPDERRMVLLPWILVSWLWGLRGLLPTRASPEWRAWLAAGLALAYVPASLVLPPPGGYSVYYYLTVLFADLVLLLVATRLLVGQAERLTGLVTAAIGVSIAALVVGRVL